MDVNANKMNNTFHPNQVKTSLLTFVTFQFVKLQCEWPPSSKGQRTSNLLPIWYDGSQYNIHTYLGRHHQRIIKSCLWVDHEILVSSSSGVKWKGQNWVRFHETRHHFTRFEGFDFDKILFHREYKTQIRDILNWE
jgi:hypothetical protein